MTEIAAEIVVVGAGPAGVAACVAASQGKKSLMLIDENRHPGGQIGRMDMRTDHNPIAMDAIAALNRIGVHRMYDTTVIDAPKPGLLLAVQDGRGLRVSYSKLILATGSRELFLPFPGWTLPGVMGAGGAQALAKSGVDFSGRRVAVSGTGPLLLAVGATLAGFGADVVGVYEQATRQALQRFLVRMVLDPARLFQGFQYWNALRPARYRPGVWVEWASGNDKLEEIGLTDGAVRWTERVDVLACGYGLIPNLELATLLGCEIADRAVVIDENQRTSVPNVFAAGEATGVGGTDVAVAEGYVAGFCASDQNSRRPLYKANRNRYLPFINLMNETFALRDQVRELAKDETLVCRCEDVSLGAIKACDSRRQAKLETRMGMGPCQGRICGAAAEVILGWTADSVRPPLSPVGAAEYADALAERY